MWNVLSRGGYVLVTSVFWLRAHGAGASIAVCFCLFYGVISKINRKRDVVQEAVSPKDGGKVC